MVCVRNEPAFPSHMDATDGVSFRQWLIGQALAGAAATGGPSQDKAAAAVWLADEVLRLLDEEAKTRSEESKKAAERIKAEEEQEQAEYAAAQPRLDPRIEAMKARQQARLDRDKAERDRQEAIANAGSALVNRLEEALKPCGELWLWLDGRADRLWLRTWHNRPQKLEVRGDRSGDVLAEFEVAGNFATGDVHLTHGGQPVTHERAVDIALAAIEKHLYADGNAGANGEPLETEIPF